MARIVKPNRYRRPELEFLPPPKTPRRHRSMGSASLGSQCWQQHSSQLYATRIQPTNEFRGPKLTANSAQKTSDICTAPLHLQPPRRQRLANGATHTVPRIKPNVAGSGTDAALKLPAPPTLPKLAFQEL